MLTWCSVKALAGLIVSEGVLVPAECESLLVDRQHSSSTSPGLGCLCPSCQAVFLCCFSPGGCTPQGQVLTGVSGCVAPLC